MNNVLRVLIDTAVRVRDFLRSFPFGSAKADAVVAQFEGKVARAQDLIKQKTEGERGIHAAAVTRADLRRHLTSETLRHLAKIANAASREKPDLADTFRQPVSTANDQEFRGVVRAIAKQAEVNKEVFLNYGLWDGAIEELTREVDALDQATTDGNAARRARTGANAELKHLGSELTSYLNQLDGMMIYRLRDHPDLRGAWNSARNVAWPLPAIADKPPATPPAEGNA